MQLHSIEYINIPWNCYSLITCRFKHVTSSSGRAISIIHAHPGKDCSVKSLAQHVAMSPSRFAARFSAALGDSPIAYVTKWRMNIAGRQLIESQQSITKIAESVGYENVSAFTRAFKRHLGVPPAVWRAEQS